jgi:hypothetical protein
LSPTRLITLPLLKSPCPFALILPEIRQEESVMLPIHNLFSGKNRW